MARCRCVSCRRREADPRHSLTPREFEVMQRIALGASVSEVATALGLASGTVANALSRVYAKLELYDRVGLLYWAMERRILPVPRRDRRPRTRAGAAPRRATARTS